jgi:hypothetical protein
MPHRLDDTDFWNDAVELVVPLWVAMAVHGYCCLGLRHPETRDNAQRPAVVRAVRRLGDLLVARGEDGLDLPPSADYAYTVLYTHNCQRFRVLHAK